MPSKREKMGWEIKQKKRGGEKVISESQDCCVTLKPKNYLENLLFVHAWNLEADIFCIWLWSAWPINSVLGDSGSSVVRQLLENGLTCFIKHFFAKFPGVNGWSGKWIHHKEGSVAIFKQHKHQTYMRHVTCYSLAIILHHCCGYESWCKS